MRQLSFFQSNSEIGGRLFLSEDKINVYPKQDATGHSLDMWEQWTWPETAFNLIHEINTEGYRSEFLQLTYHWSKGRDMGNSVMQDICPGVSRAQTH